MTVYTYTLTTQEGRANLDKKAYDDGDEDGSTCYADNAILVGEDLQTRAKSEAKSVLEDAPEQENNHGITDDEEEFLARYIPNYISGYTDAVKSLRADAIHERGKEA